MALQINGYLSTFLARKRPWSSHIPYRLVVERLLPLRKNGTLSVDVHKQSLFRLLQRVYYLLFVHLCK